jgi:hypothetical protein
LLSFALWLLTDRFAAQSKAARQKTKPKDSNVPIPTRPDVSRASLERAPEADRTARST